jgi:hypothetical protein
MKYQLSILLLSALSAVYISHVSFADMTYAENDRETALQACAQQAGIELPTAASERKNMSRDDKQRIRLCMADKGFRSPSSETRSKDAIDKCLAQSGVTLPVQPVSFENLDSNTREAIIACRSQI